MCNRFMFDSVYGKRKGEQVEEDETCQRVDAWGPPPPPGQAGPRSTHYPTGYLTPQRYLHAPLLLSIDR